MPSPPRTQRTPDFRTDFERTVNGLRGALIELYAAAGADPRAPQQVARDLGINRNLAWQIGKVINASDAQEAFTHLPARGSMKILLKAFEGPAPASTRESVRQAMEAFRQVVEQHAGNKATLDVLVRNLYADPKGAPFSEASRKQSFLGNSAIWGSQARARSLTQILAPNAQDPGRLDNAMVGGVYDYRRLRAEVTWPLGQRVIHGELEGASQEPIDTGAEEPEGLPLMREFCSSPLPDLSAVREGDYTITELREGPVGSTGALTCVFGWIMRSYSPASRTPDARFAEYVLRLDTPVEFALFDLLVHRDLPFEGAPGLCLYSLMHGRLELPLCRHERYHLPIDEAPIELGSSPPILATPHVARYTEMVGVAAKRLGHELRDFRGYRFAMTYPPIPTVADLYYTLPAPT